MSTRREFLLNCSALAATAALVPATALAARSSHLREVTLDNISAALWAEQLKTPFIVRSKTGSVTVLQLAAVEPFDGVQIAAVTETIGSQERFSLFFVGDASAPLAQDTHWFEHAGLGRFEMFIVPIWRPDGTRCAYEAVFDRPAPVPSRGRPSVIHRSR